MSPGATPDVLLADLLKRYPRRVETLKIVDSVCRAVVRHGGGDFSIANIGRLSKESGGVDAPYMRNERGKPFRMLIDAHAAAARPKKAPRVLREPGAVESQFPDPQQRAIVIGLMGEVRFAKAEATEERNRANDLQKIVDRSAVVSIHGGTASYGLRSNLELLPIERDSVRKVLDLSWQTSKKLVSDERGRLLDVSGKEVLPIGFLGMLAKFRDALGLVDAAASPEA